MEVLRKVPGGATLPLMLRSEDEVVFWVVG